MARINLNNFGVAPITTPGAALKPAAYARPAAKRLDLTKFNIPMIVSRSPQYNAPQSALPKSMLQGAMAASQSQQTKAIKDYNTPSMWHPSQAESDKLLIEVEKMNAYYGDKPKYLPVTDMMDSFNMAFSGDYTSSSSPAMAAVNFVGTLAKVAVGAWLITTVAAGAITAVVGTVKAIRANLANTETLRNSFNAAKIDRDSASEGSPFRVGLDFKAVTKANYAGKAFQDIASDKTINIVNGKVIIATSEEKFDAYLKMVEAVRDASRSAHAVSMAEATSKNIALVPAGAFSAAFGQQASIVPYIPVGIPELASLSKVAIPMPAVQQTLTIPYAADVPTGYMGEVSYVKPGTTSPAGIPPTLGNAVGPLGRTNVERAVNGVQPYEMSFNQFLETYAVIPPMKPLPENGDWYAIKTDDKSIFVGKSPYATHFEIAMENNVPFSRLAGRGFVREGIYYGGEPTPILGIKERALAAERIRYEQIVRNEETLRKKYNLSPINYRGTTSVTAPSTLTSAGNVLGPSELTQYYDTSFMDTSNAADYIENGTYGVVSVFTSAPEGSTSEVVAAKLKENQALADKYAATTNRHEAIASYGGMEKSFIVPAGETLGLGEQFKQQSVMTANHHHYEIIDLATGKKTMEGDVMEFDPNATDFYTEVMTAQGPLRFSVTDMHDVTGGGMTEADYAAKQGEAQALLRAAVSQGIPASPRPAGTTQQGAKDATVSNFARKVYEANNSTGIERAFSYSGFSGEYLVHGLATGNSIVTTTGIDSVAVTEGFIDAYLNHPENLHITPVRFDLAKNAGAVFTDSHGGLIASGKSITAIQNKLDNGKIVIKLIANATGSKSKLASIRNMGIREIWTMYSENLIFRDEVQKQMPGFLEIHPDLQWQEKGITREDRLLLNKIAYGITDDYNLQRAGKISGILILSKNGLFNSVDLSWNPRDVIIESYQSIYSGVFHRFDDVALMPDYEKITTADAITRGLKPTVYVSPFAENVELSINTPEVKAVIDTLAQGIQDYRRQVGLSSGGNIVNVPQNVANAPQPETGGTIDMSKYQPEITPEEVVAGINGAMRPGALNIGKVAHLLNTPERIAAQLLRDDPLKYGLDKLGIYNLLYGKGTNKELRAGTGNPSIWNMQFVPATVKNVMLWGPLFTGETRMTFKDISVEADRQREALIKIDRQLSKLTQDEFIDVMWKISHGGSKVPAISGVPPTISKTQQMADAYNAATERVSKNLIAAGLDPNIFARLKGHYLPAPFDELGRDILPNIDEKLTVKPGLSFIEKQTVSQQDVIGYASADDTWQDYRDYMISRIAAEIRAGEKGRFFNAIANDPHTNAIDPKSIDYNTGKRVILPKGYVEFSLGGQKSAFALDGLAIPKWVALFIKNEFTSAAAMEQMKGIQELLGQWKWNKAIANIPTAVRNMISQLTAQSLEAGMSVMNLDDYIIRPLGALFGLNKADKKQLVDLGILDVGLTRELEGLGFSPQERELWMSGKDRGLMLGMVYDKMKTARNVLSTAYAFSDNLTKAGSFYTALRTYDARTARVISSITTGDYSQRPPMINFLSRGIYNGKVNPLAMIISSPFSFFKTVVEPQRVGNLIRNRPSLFVLYALVAGLVLKGLKKKIMRDYEKSEQETEALINEFNNYQWLNGRLVIPTGLNEGIDVTPMIPMINFIVEAKRALIENRHLVETISTTLKLVSGTDSVNFVVEVIGALATGNDLNYFLRYGTVKSIGKTNVEQLLWLVAQFSPTWLSKLFIKKPNGKPFTLQDLLGTYKVVETEADKNKMWYYTRTDPNISVEEKKRMAAALFGPKSIEQIGWDRIMGH